MLRKSYDWAMRQATSPHATRALAVVSFIDSSFFPIPPFALMVPMVLADRLKAWRLAFLCTVSSVLGGYLGYLIGAMLYDVVAQPLLQLYGYTEKFLAFKSWYDTYGGWFIILMGISPFPYKVVTIASGTVHMNLLEFGVASIVARSMRFYVVGGLLWKFGEPMRDILDRHLGKASLALFLFIVGVVASLKLLPG